MISANLPWVESPFFEDELKAKELSPEDRQLAIDYHNNGFVVIGGMLPMELIDAVQKEAQEKAFNPSFPIKTQRDKARVQDFWKVSEPSKQLACFPPLLDKLALLYGRKPVPFQTLNFSVGSQQRAHSDTIHFSSLPAKFMCGVWVALEDITEDNGPVFYYPGSQRLPEYDYSHIQTRPHASSYEEYIQYEDFIERIVKVNGFEKKKFLAKKGDLLIWASNIIHGGSPVLKEGSSRWSQVTHYFFEDCIYYTPMLSNMVTKELYVRRGLKDIRTGREVNQSYNGVPIRIMRSSGKMFILNNNMGKLSKLFAK